MKTNYVYIQNWFRSFFEFTLLVTLQIQANKSALWKQALFKTFNSIHTHDSAIFNSSVFLCHPQL